jgi:membrane protein DedA with SNARE-associated domain
MLFAGFAVADPSQSASHHHLTMVGIVLAGLLGTVVGSWVAYGVGRGGRLELLERHGHLLHVGPAQIARADRFFARYGQATVLFGRMVPFVRAFVSLPAGVARMPFVRFTVLTVIGSLPWVLALAIAGHAVGGDWTSIRKGFEYVDYVVVALLVVGIAYAVIRRRSRPRGPAEPAASGSTADVASGSTADVG